MRKGIPTTLLLCGTVFVTAVVAQPKPRVIAATSDAKTLLQIPSVDYRRSWVLLGSFSVLADDPNEGAKELHVVYTQPESVDSYRKAGAFPNGTILIKDVFATKTEALTTGTSSYADTLIGRFIMVKDISDKHAAASPLWGDGWGWAFYEGAETIKPITTDYRENCLACHEPARNQDLIYIQGYPILKK
jgi:hypothetical protein